SGTGFTAAATVKFGGTPATPVTFVSSTVLKATSPAGTAGTVDVTVTTAGGTSALSAADQFKYRAEPTVTGVSPASGPTAGGTVVTITGTGFTAAATVKLGGTPATVVTFVSSTILKATSPAGTAGTVDVTVTTTGGTSATSALDQYTYL
ncbi:MAG TPA: IPT/TIG domain-containing protein, partial [Streptosporangiaceae bacterium]